jgi:hypothetical protein
VEAASKDPCAGLLHECAFISPLRRPYSQLYPHRAALQRNSLSARSTLFHLGMCRSYSSACGSRVCRALPHGVLRMKSALLQSRTLPNTIIRCLISRRSAGFVVVACNTPFLALLAQAPRLPASLPISSGVYFYVLKHEHSCNLDLHKHGCVLVTQQNLWFNFV